MDVETESKPYINDEIEDEEIKQKETNENQNDIDWLSLVDDDDEYYDDDY